MCETPLTSQNSFTKSAGPIYDGAQEDKSRKKEGPRKILTITILKGMGGGGGTAAAGISFIFKRKDKNH